VNIGVLGFAHGHVGMYCARWREHAEWGVRLDAGWDHEPARLADAVKKHGVESCASAGALLARPDVQAVVIAAETSLHAGLVEQAAAAGKAIVLQKPLCLTLSEADRIVEAVRRHGVPFSLAWQMRVDPHNLQARDLLASGRFGRVFMVRRRHCLNTHDWPAFDQSWHVQPALNRDIFMDDAAHAVDFLYWLRGMPVSVVAELGSLLNPKIPNDNGIAVFRQADGSFSEIVCCFATPAGENTLEITCEHGVIIGNYGDGPSNSVRPDNAPQLKWWLRGSGWTISDLPPIKGQGERIQNLAEPLAAFLNGRRPPIATAGEGRDVLRLMLACADSSATGSRITMQNEP
jgi:predicted dehydrogenase